MEENVLASQEYPKSRQERKLREALGLGEGWTFVPETEGFRKSQPCRLPPALQELYERQNGHTP